MNEEISHEENEGRKEDGEIFIPSEISLNRVLLSKFVTKVSSDNKRHEST